MKSAAKMPAKRMKTEGCQSATLIHHSHAVRPPQRAPKARRTQAVNAALIRIGAAEFSGDQAVGDEKEDHGEYPPEDGLRTDGR